MIKEQIPVTSSLHLVQTHKKSKLEPLVLGFWGQDSGGEIMYNYARISEV